MTIRLYRCEACNLLFFTDLEVGEGLIELRSCPCCGNAGHIRREGDEVRLCAACVGRLPDLPDEADEAAAFIQ